MTKSELATLLSYTRLRDRSRRACELVLVEGKSQADAARIVGTSREAVSEAIQSVRKAETKKAVLAMGHRNEIIARGGALARELGNGIEGYVTLIDGLLDMAEAEHGMASAILRRLAEKRSQSGG